GRAGGGGPAGFGGGGGARAGGRGPGAGAGRGAAGGGGGKKPPADRGEREQRHDQAGGQAHAPAEHAADPGRRLVLLGDLHFPVGAALDHGGVVGVDQVCLGVQVLDELVVGVGVPDVVVHPDVGDERVNCHRGPSPGTWACGGGEVQPPAAHASASSLAKIASVACCPRTTRSPRNS